MKTLLWGAILVGSLVLTRPFPGWAETAPAKEREPNLDAHLEPLRPLLGKTFKGTFKVSTPEKPMVDISCWERILNGQAIRMTHSLNEGAYGGESIIRWDAQKKSVVYHYFTTAGFTTTGTMEFKDGKILTHEVVSGASHVNEVRGTSEILSGGRLRVKTEHGQDGKWSEGREVTYEPAPGTKLVFR
jgi:hypothetical protein